MSAQSNSSHADESPPIIVFQSRALRIPSVGDNEFGSLKDLQFSTPRKRSLETDSARSPTHISKRSRLCAGGSSAPHPKFELRVQPVNMSFVLSAADNSENSPPRLMAALQRPWVLDAHPFVGQSCILQLPDDALDHVISLATRDADDALKISLACRRFKLVTASSSAWKNIVDRGWSERCDIVMPALERAPNQSWMQLHRLRMSSYLPHASYLRRHITLTVKKRSILVNWMLGVSYEFGSSSDTILQHTAVSLLDSYLNVRTAPISQNEFQCVGAACLVKALQDVCQLDCIKVAMSCVLAAWYTKDVCSAEDVIATVQQITSTLPPHREGAPVHAVITRLLRSMRKGAAGSRTFCLTHYLGELALQSEAMLMFTPDAIACSCFAVACNCLGWNEPIFMSVINEVCAVSSILSIAYSMRYIWRLFQKASQLLVASRAASCPAPSVVHKYRRQSRLQVSYLAVPESPWPQSCPHGAARDSNCECSCLACHVELAAQSHVTHQHGCTSAADNEVCDILGALELPEHEDSMDAIMFQTRPPDIRIEDCEYSSTLGPTPPPTEGRSDQQALVGLTSPRGFVFRRTSGSFVTPSAGNDATRMRRWASRISLQANEASHQQGDSGWNHPALPSTGEPPAHHEAAFDVLRAGP